MAVETWAVLVDGSYSFSELYLTVVKKQLTDSTDSLMFLFCSTAGFVYMVC